MTEQQRAELREHARTVAAEAPPLTDEKRARLAALLASAVPAAEIAPASPRKRVQKAA